MTTDTISFFFYVFMWLAVLNYELNIEDEFFDMRFWELASSFVSEPGPPKDVDSMYYGCKIQKSNYMNHAKA